MRQIVKQRLKEFGKSPKQLGADLKIRQQTITDWLNGSKGINFEYFERICKYLDLEITCSL